MATFRSPSPLRLATADPAPSGPGEDPPALGAEALVDGLRRGDPAITARFFEIYAGRVERTLRHLLGPIDELEDLVHDVFVDAIEAIDKLREPAALSGWMRGIAVITAKRRLMRFYRRRWLGLTATGDLPEMPVSPRDIESREAFRSLHQVLSQLHPEDRIAVILYRVEELTVEQAALTMGVSGSTFKRRLRRGEERLTKLSKNNEALKIWLGPEAER